MVCAHDYKVSSVASWKRWGGVRLDLLHEIVSRRYGYFDYAHYDPVYKECVKQGVKVLFVLFLDNPNIWRGEGRYVPTDAKALRIVEDFARQTARQYPLAEWEIQNEPNWAKSMKGKAWTPVEYARIARAALNGIRSVSKSRVYLGALANEAGTDMPDIPFLEKMLADEATGGGGLWRALDENTGLSFHPYTMGIPETRYRYTDLVRFHASGMMAVDKDFPVAYTEWGYREAWCPALGADKGTLIKRMFDVGEQDGVPIWVYSWDDPTGEGYAVKDVQIAG